MESKGVERDLREGISKARKGGRQAPFTSLPLFVGAAFTVQQMLCASFRKGPEREGEHLGIHVSRSCLGETCETQGVLPSLHCRAVTFPFPLWPSPSWDCSSVARDMGSWHGFVERLDWCQLYSADSVQFGWIQSNRRGMYHDSLDA